MENVVIARELPLSTDEIIYTVTRAGTHTAPSKSEKEREPHRCSCIPIPSLWRGRSD